MLEEQLAYYLEKYLGNYVQGLSKEALKVSVWQGNVELTNMHLKPEALNALKLPIKVKAGFLGSVKLKVPWSRLGQEPVVVELDRIFVLAEPSTNVQGSGADSVQAGKIQCVQEEEERLLSHKDKDKDRQKPAEKSDSSWLGSVIATVIGNLKLSITNIHIRYEDTESNLGHPFAAGLTLAKLGAVTVDEDGKEIFVTGGALDRIQKSAELNRLAFYFDPDTDPWPMEKWEELLPKEWNKVFMPGIKEDPSSIIGDKPEWIQDHQYVLEPVAGTAKYFRLGQKDSRTPDRPPQKAVVILEDVTLSLSEKQYRDAVKLMENISTFKKRVQYAHYRPNVSISADKNAWWKYTYAAITEQRRRASGHLSWQDILKYSKMRKNYVSKYIELLEANPKQKSINKNKEIQEFDRQLDPKIIIQWRMLAHTYVEQERAKDAIHQQSKKSWWAFGWGSGSDESNRKNRELTEDDWKQVNEIIGYEQGKSSPMLPDVDLPNMVHSVVEIEMKHNGTRLLSGDRKVRILELTAEGIGCNVKLYPQTQVFDVKLSSYKFSCPEGLLGESAMDEKSLYGTFTLHPWDREVDWMLKAKAAPCYVTVLMPSINRVTQFFSSKEAVSQRVALQTAAALQSTVNEVSKNAQHQLNDALKNKPRFLLDLDIDAPKVVIPTEFYPDGKHQCKLFLDLGHFKIMTVPENGSLDNSSQEKELYMRFRVSLSDISAFFVDGEFRWWKQQYSVGGGGGSGSLASMGKKLQLEKVKDNGNNEQKENIDSGHHHVHHDENGNGKKIANENVNVQENHNKSTELVDGKEKSGGGVIQAAGSKRLEEKAAEKEKEDIGEPKKMQEGSKIEDGESSTSAEEDEVNAGDLFFLPLLKKTGMVVALEQICVPHPKYPSTRVAIRLPSLGFQFSPARYHRLMQVIDVFSSQSSKGGSDSATSSIRPWDPADFEGPLSVLSWKGVGHREATWERYHGALAGPFLYLLESPSVQSYKSYHSLLGKKVFNVPPESVGAVKNVLAVCDSSQLDSKVVESANALLLRFDNDAARENWQARLLGAIYHGSSPAAVAGIIKSGKSAQKDPKEMVTEAAEGHDHQQKMNPAEQETFFLTGVLDELKFIVSNSLDNDHVSKALLLEPEKPILEFCAIGTKVQFVRRKYDMLVGAVLQSLEIEDKYHGHVSYSCRYLARSYIKHEQRVGKEGQGRRQGQMLLHHQKEGYSDDDDQGGLKALSEQEDKSSQTSERLGRMNSEANDRFFDANDESDRSDGSRSPQRQDSLSFAAASQFYDADNGENAEEDDPPSFKREVGLLPGSASPLPDLNNEDVSQNEELKNFVKAQVIISSQESPEYTNIDKQVRVSLSTLSFYCNRPTIIAILDLVTAINAKFEAPSAATDDSKVDVTNKEAADEPLPSATDDEQQDVKPTSCGSSQEDINNFDRDDEKEPPKEEDTEFKEQHVSGQASTSTADDHEKTKNKDIEPSASNKAGENQASQSAGNAAGSHVTTIDPTVIEDVDDYGNATIAPEGEDSVVKGLLGKGKERVVFCVALDMELAEIVLNLEDGQQLATLSQKALHAEVKVFPASWGVKATLGNLRISDDFIRNQQQDGVIPYPFICDMRDPAGSSFIELEFLSFSKDDIDYKGYEYSITGKLSEVRFVFLYRFIQEITAYFMGLVPQSSGYVMKLKDRATNYEKLFTQSEIEGSPSLKMDLALSNPIIIMPRATYSNDYMELDVQQVNVKSKSDWFGGDKEELGSIRLETITLEVDDVSLEVGVGGKSGDKIIERADGISLVVRRPLRDLWHQVPGIEATVKIEQLRASLSDKEYQVITECATCNMAEVPNLPPSLFEEKSGEEDKDEEDKEQQANDEAGKLKVSGADDSEVVLVDPDDDADDGEEKKEGGSLSSSGYDKETHEKVTHYNQSEDSKAVDEPLEHSCYEVIQEGDPLEHKEEDCSDESSIDKPFTTIKVSVDIKLVELGLYVGGMRTAALATIQVRGVWVAYKSNNLEEMNVMASLERFSVKDDREGSEPEMRYMIGSADDWVHNPTTQRDPIDDQKPFEEQEEGMERDNNNNPFSDHKMGWCSALTMLVVDAMLGPTQQTVSLRIQRPRVTVAFDFLLAVAEFFVPSMHAMLSDKGDENPLDLTNGIFLDKPTYKQKTRVVEITPKKPLIADHELVDEYTYDGQGNTLRLLNRTGTDLSDYAPEALIFIGDGKRLSFRNIVIQNGAYLDSSIALGSNSSYSASEDDGVFLEDTPNEQLDRNSVKGDGENNDNEKKKERGNDDNNPPQTKLTIELQAIGPELTLYNSLGRPSEAFFLPESFLRARMNAFVRYTSKGEDMELNANLNTLTIEAKSGITVMEPFNADMSYSKVAGKQNICAKMTEICTHFSFSILHLILRLQDDVMSFMRITSEEMTVECSEFDKIWVSTNWEESKGQQHIAFWRPRPPPGFAVLGDCFTPLNEAPAKGVLALNMALVQVKRAESFKLMWSSTKQATSSRQQQLLSTNNNGSERANSEQKAAAAEFGGDEEMDENKLCQDDSSSSDARRDSLSDNRQEYSSSFGLGQQSGISSGRIDYKDLLDSKENDEETDCSIWIPVAPQGYVALGCVACKGQRPPPTTASLCVLAALVSPCSMRDCIYVTSEVNEDLIPDKGWAFWQVDNSAGTFFVEPVIDNEVSMPRGYELRHAIISYTVFPVNETKPSTSTDQPSSKVSRTVSERPQEGQEGARALMSTTASASSGRMYEHVTEFKPIWWAEGSKFWKDISIWRPVVQPGFAILGDVAVKGYKPPSMGLVLWDANEDGGGGLFAKPEKFEKQGYLKDDIAFWLPVAPLGYVSLGCVASRSSSPDKDLHNIVRCVRSDLVLGTDFASCIANTSSIKHRAAELSIWPVENKAKTFFVIPAINKRPPADLAQCLAFVDKPRKPDNLIANLEVKGISATVSDDFGGLMAPILDFSVTSMQASLHGCMEAFSMETNFALSSSTYNGRYSAWEPLIEPCDTKVRYVYSSDPDEKVQPTVSEITMKLTKDLNMNVSVANINLFLEAYASWTSLSKLEQGSSKQQFLQDQGGVSQRSMSNSNKPMRVGISNKCLDGKPNKRFYIVTHNAMGEPLYLRTIESSGRMHMAFLPAEGMAAIKIPMPRSMKDSAHKILEKVWPGIFVTIRVGYAELPADKGIGGREYMAGIRIVSSKPVSERMDVPLQSARTRCVHPERETANGQVQVFWDEVFIFEVKPGELSKAEILVMDLTRGIPVGFCSLSLLERGNELQEDSQDSLLEYGKKQKTTVDTPSWSSSSSLELKSELLYHPPTEKQEQDSSNDESARGDKAIGKLYTSYNFSSITGDEISRREEGCPENSSDQDGGDQEPGGAIEVAISKQGPWFPVVVNYGLGPAAWHLGKDIFLASEMMVEEMIKHLFVRTMVTVENASEFILEVRLCLDSLLDKTEEEIKGAAVEQQQEEDAHHPAHESCLYLSDVGPNSSISCPLKSLCPGSPEYCLQVRPQLGSHKWSMVVPIKGKQDMGKKQVPVKKFRVNALSETEELLCCPIAIPAGGHAAQSKGGKDVWFCIESKAKEIGKTSQLDPILDWKLTVSAPLQLINYLPIPCRFTLSGDEKVPGENQQESINLDSGVVNAGKSAFIFHVDLRKALYLYWVPQGSWQPKDAVIISHPQKDLAKEIIVSNSVRDLKIHIQHEREEKGMTAKVIYFYVPCWLDSERCPLLKIRLVELELPKEKKGKKKEKAESTKHEKKKTLLQPPLKVKNVIDEINQDNMEQVHHQTMLSRYEPKMMGLAVALSADDDNTHFGEVEPLEPLDDSDGSVELITQDVQGSYYKFLVTRMSNPYGFAQAEVLCIRPYTIFTNWIGQRIHLRQEGAEQFRTIDPTDSTTILPFVKVQEPLKLQVQLEGSLWSHPFTIQKEEKMYLAIHPSNGRSSRRRSIRIDVRGYEDGSRFWVLLQCGSSRGPYRLENRTMSTQIKFRQVGFDDDAWCWIKPHSTVAFAWDNPQGEQLLEVIPDGDTSSSSSSSLSSSSTGLIRIDISKVGDHPVLSTTNGPNTRNNICMRVLEAVDIKVVRFFDQEMTIHQSRSSSAEDEGETEMSVPVEGASQPMQANNLDKRPDAPSQFKFVLDVGKLGLSIINHQPRELLFLHMERVKVEISYSSGSSSQNTNSGIVLVVGYMQIDNQLPLTPMPVLLAPECKEKEESVLEIVLQMKSDSSEVKEVYPCIGLKTTESAWRLNIHEEMIWMAVEMYTYLRLDRLSSDSDVVQVDPEIQVELLHMSEVRFKLTIETCPEQRPPGKLGIWGPIVSTVGNISKMPVHLHNIIRKNRYMRKSQVTTAVVDHIKHDLVHQPLQLLMGINLWGMTSSTLGTMSRGAASLSKDSGYLQMRSNQEKARRVRGVRDGVLQGTSTFARGVSYGFKGIVTKPAEGVRTKGVMGAFQGFAKAIVGVIVQPISGCLDFGALMVSGVGTSCTHCFAAIEQEPTFERSRLPRAIQGKVLTPYNEHSAQGQAILHLVQSRFLGKDVFRERGQSSHSDYYQAHFYLPRDFILLLTNRHVSMLKPPAAHARDPNKELTNPRTIEWKVRWEKLVNPFSSLAGSSSSSLMQLHCQDASNQFTKVIECFQPAEESGNSQALQICEAIQHYQRMFCSDPEVLPTAKTRRVPTNMFKHRSVNKKKNLGRKNHKGEVTTNCSLKDYSEEGPQESSSSSQHAFQEVTVEEGETDSPEINEEIIPT